MGLLLLFLFGAMGISFICSVLESVLLTTPVSYLTMLQEDGNKNAALFLRLKDNIDKPIAAILSLNTIANTIGAAGVGRQSTLVFGSEWFGLISVIVTILILIFAEIIPKTIGTSYWKRLTWVARIIQFLIWILYPLVILIRFISKVVSPDEEDPTVSREEVSAMANIGEEEGVLDKSENKVIQNIMRLDDVKAYDVMTPRVVAAIAPESMTLSEFYRNEDLSHYSRIPVWQESPEYITGYVLRYDILERLAEDKFNTTLGQIKRDITLFNEETSVGDIWESLLKTKDQIALIIDDYGCFQGILTLEDIIETILGLEIIDENDAYTDMQQYARERWTQRQRQRKGIRLPMISDPSANDGGDKSGADAPLGNDAGEVGADSNPEPTNP